MIASVLAPCCVSAQKYFRSFNSQDGLPDNTVYCIRQDNRGYLWTGTSNGLSRFDGLSFTTYTNAPGDDGSLVCDIVRDIQPTDSGLWIATDHGVDFYSYRDGIFHHCKARITRGPTTDLYRYNHFVSTGRNLFVTDNNGHVYHHTSGYDFDAIDQHGQRYDALTTLRDGLLIAAGPKGLYLIGEDSYDIIDHLVFDARITSLVNLYYSKNKSTVFLGYGIGYDSRAFSIVNNRIKESGALVPPSLMATCDYGALTVFGTDGGGLLLDNGESQTYYTPSNSNISGDAVYSLFVDDRGNLWTGTYRMGLNLYSERFRWFNILSRANHQLTYDIVTAILPCGDRLYIGLDGGGLETYHPSSGSVTTLTAHNSQLPGNNVISLLSDGPYLWMAVYTKGLVRLNTADNSMRVYRMPMVEPDANNVWTLCDDSLGHIWVGGPDVFVFDKQAGQAVAVDSVRHCLALALQGKYMWVASRYDGLYKLDRASRKVVAHYTQKTSPLAVPAGELSFIHIDRAGCLWLSTEQGVFCRFDEHARTVRLYGIEQGLANTRVMSLEEDDNGHMLLGTAKGLFLFDPAKDIFIPLGFDATMSEFTPHGSARDSKYMYFGTTNGMVYFDPQAIRTTSSRHRVSYSRLVLTSGDMADIDLYRDSLGVVRLSHDQNFFTVFFSVPELVSPDGVKLECMLKGLESQWHDLGPRREASYTNVPPGDYELLVRCSNMDGSWSEPTVLHLHISPPWYLSYWARLLWLFAGLAVVYAAIRFYLRELRIKHHVELVKVEKESQRKLDDAKMDFYTSITHELRTPVFLIAAQLEEIMEGAKDTVKVPYTYLASVRRNALRLNELISRVVDFRKIGAENLSLSLQYGDVARFFADKSEAYTDMFRQKDIVYSYESSSPEIMTSYDPLKLELIVSNLLSNAFKYTSRGGKVSFSITEEPERIVMRVTDNGIGIDERFRDTIFESFFRSDRGKRASEGDGLGLSYVKNLVELHGGRISVDSEMGRGSVFEFYIPKQQPGTSSGTNALLLDAPLHKNNPAATHTILIVDDERETVDVLERYLGKDFRVEKAYDGEEGLAKTYECLPDVVLIDLMMPRMGGLEMLTRIRHDKKLERIKTIVFTAKSSEDDMLSAFDSGADVYLTKPVSLKLLRKRINKLITSSTASTPLPQHEGDRKTYSKEEQMFLLRCREVIDNNLTNPDFNIAYMASQLGMSHSPLYKKLKQMTGMSLIEFVNDYRIYKAVQMFRDGETNVETAASAVGINDMKNFRTLFKRKMQVTPRQFIQSL